MQPVQQTQPATANSVEDDSPRQLVSGVSNDSQFNPQQAQLSRADPDVSAAELLSNLPGCPKKAFLDINWHPPSRSGAFKLRTKVSLADEALEHAEQAIFLFIFPDKVRGLSLTSVPEPVQGGHTHILHFDLKSPPTFVSPTKNLDSADPDSVKAIRLFSDLVNFSTLELPLDLAAVSSLPATSTAPITNATLATLEEMCQAFQDGNGMASILSCLNVSSLYNGNGGVPTTLAQFPDANPPDDTSSRKRSASYSIASRPRQRPRPDSHADSPQFLVEQHQLGLDLSEDLSRRIDTAVQKMEASRASSEARLQSMIEARSDVLSRQHRSLIDEVDTQQARFDAVVARSDARLRSLTGQCDSTRARAEPRAVHLQALNGELRFDRSRRLNSLGGQLHTQNAASIRLIDSLAERVGYIEQDMRSTNDPVRRNQRLLNFVEVKLGSRIYRIWRGDMQNGGDLTQDLRRGGRRREGAVQEET